MDEVQKAIWDALLEMSGEDVARAFTNYYGNQILTEQFYIHMVDEGYMGDELGLMCPDEDEDEDY